MKNKKMVNAGKLAWQTRLHGKKIESKINRTPKNSFLKNDKERKDSVNDIDGLYYKQQKSGLNMRDFVRKNRKLIDSTALLMWNEMRGE